MIFMKPIPIAAIAGKKISSMAFKRKGRAEKHEQHRKMLHSLLLEERATRMEGSFGTEKEH